MGYWFPGTNDLASLPILFKLGTTGRRRSLHTHPLTGRQFPSGTWFLWSHDDLMKPFIHLRPPRLCARFLPAHLPKNAPAKALLAHIITEQTSVPQKWFSQTLLMGSAPYVSKLAKEMKLAMPRLLWTRLAQQVLNRPQSTIKNRLAKSSFILHTCSYD